MKSIRKESWLDKLKPSNKNTIIQSKFKTLSSSHELKVDDDKLNLSLIQYINSGHEFSISDMNISEHEETIKNFENINNFIEERYQMEITERFFLKQNFHSIIPFFLVSDKSIHRLTLSDYEIKIICKEHHEKSKVRRESVDYYKIGLVNFYRSRFDLAYTKFKNAYEANEKDINASKWLCFTILILLNPDIVKDKRIDFSQVSTSISLQEESKISFFKCCSTRKPSIPVWEGDAEIPKNEVLVSELIDAMTRLEKRMEGDQSLEKNRLEVWWLKLIMIAFNTVNPSINNFNLNQDYKSTLKKIKSVDPYISYLAYGEYHYITNKTFDYSKLLNTLVATYPNRVEAYLRYWTILTNKKGKLKDYEMAYNICKIFSLNNLTFNFDQNYPTYTVYNIITYIKSCFLTDNEIEGINRLQIEYPSNFMYPSLYFLLGKYLAKSKSNTQKLTGAGVLIEATRLLYNDMKKTAYYWLGKIYFDLRRFDLCFTYWNEYSVGSGKASVSKATMVEDFIKWYSDSSYSLETIKNVRNSKKKLPLSFYLDCINRINKDESMINMVYKASCYLYVQRNLQDSSKILMKVINNNKFLMEAHFLMWKILKEHKDYKLLLKYSLLMTKIAYQIEVHTGNWLMSMIYYSKALLLNNKHEDALQLLKNLLDLFTNIPIDNLKFLDKVFLENRKSTTNFIPETETALSLYSRYHVYKISESILQMTRKSSTKGVPINSKDESDVSKQTTLKSDNSAVPCIQYSDIPGINELIEYTESNVNNIEVTPMNEYLNIISDPIVLYHIGKTCAKGDFKWELGILCLRDFLKLLKFESNYMLDTTGEKKRFKAYFWFGLLYAQMKDYKNAKKYFDRYENYNQGNEKKRRVIKMFANYYKPLQSLINFTKSEFVISKKDLREL